MKFVINRELLEGALQNLIGVVERRHTLPILGNVLVRADEKEMLLIATDLEVEIAQTLVHACDQAGETTVPGRKLYDICRSLPPNSSISIASQEGTIELKSGRSRFTLSTLPAQDFPQTEKMQAQLDIQVPENALRSLIEHTQFCMAHQDARYYLNGLMLEFRASGLRAVATDGHRLGLCDWQSPMTASELPCQVILPRKAVGELLRLTKEKTDLVSLQVGGHHLSVRLGNITLTSKLIDGRFPDYERVIPKVEDGHAVIADRKELMAALSRAAILSSEKFRGIRLGLSGSVMNIQANNPEREAAEDEVKISYQGPDLEIGFNVSYLLEALGGLSSDKACLVVSNPNSSCLIIEPGNTSKQYVVMPMRL